MSTAPPALTEAEQNALTVAIRGRFPLSAILGLVEQVKSDAYAAGLAARLSTATGVTAGDDLRDRVAALADEWDACDEHGNPLREGSLGEAADDLRAALTASSAPVVSRPEAEVKAEALREAADEMVGRGGTNSHARFLRARAASLAADPHTRTP